MTWMTWRQHRAAAAIGAVILAAIAAALIWLGVTARSKRPALRPHDVSPQRNRLHDRDQRTCNANTTGSRPSPRASSRSRSSPACSGARPSSPARSKPAPTGWSGPNPSADCAGSPQNWHSYSARPQPPPSRSACSPYGRSNHSSPYSATGSAAAGSTYKESSPPRTCSSRSRSAACMGAVWRKTIPAMATTIVGFAAVRIPIHNLRRHLHIPQHQDDRRSHRQHDREGAAARRRQRLKRHGQRDSVPAIGSSAKPPPAYRRPDLRPKDPQPASTATYPPDGSGPSRASKPRSSSSLTAALIAVCITVVVRSRPH